MIVGGALITIVLVTIVVVRNWGISGQSDYDAVRAASTSDFRDFWFTARHFKDTGQITTDYGVHNYLPFFVIFMLPLSFLPLPVAAGLFTLFSLGLVALTVVLIEALLNERLDRRPRRATLAALGLMLAYIASASVLGTVNLLVLFLIIAAWVLFEQQREWVAGIPLGLAILIKLLPGALVVFFLLKRRWRVAAATAIVLLVGGLGVPLASLGYQRTSDQMSGFVDRALVQHSARATLTADKPPKTHESNNALPMVLRRLCTPVGDHSQSAGWNVSVLNIPTGALLWVYFILLALILAISTFRTLAGPGKWPPADVASVTLVRAQFGIWCCVMLLAAPLVWTHYFVLAYWPLTLLADRAQRTEISRNSEHHAALAALLVWLVGVVLLAWPAARAAGAQLLPVFVAWGVLCYITRRTRPAAEAPTSTTL
ncbi:MAG: DUF2029 domain-containing protein [Phycisphaerae bacterium]|nr:DUF2029 domain-containing protein [Phycisphaerae bacterium]